MAVELRTRLTDAGAAARRKFRGLRGKDKAAMPGGPDGALAVDDGQAVQMAPSESLVTQAWAAVERRAW